MDVELTWLRSWLEVVDSGGFARAAERIHLSQPRISAHVASLERVLGSTLIERRIRPLTLTDDGRRLLPRARAIIAAVDDTVSDLRSTAGGCAGRLTIASFASASSAFLPQVLMDLRAANPLLDTRVIDGDVAVIEAMLSERRASVALRPFRPEPSDHGLISRDLWREPLVVLAPADHPICQNDVIRLEDVARFPVITIGDPASDPLLGYEASAAMHSRRIEPLVGIVSHQPTTLAAMVRAGHGLGVINALATTMVRLDDLVVMELSSPNLYRDVGLWWHADRPLSRASQAFVDLAVAADPPAGTMPIGSE